MKKTTLTTLTALMAASLLTGPVLAAKSPPPAAPLMTAPGNTNSPDAVNSTPNSYIVLDLGGAVSMDGLGDPDNQTAICVTGDSVTGIGWDNVGITTVGASWLSEATIMFGTPTTPVQVQLAPSTTSAPGSESGLSSGGIVDFTDNSIPDIVLGADPLRLEFFEGFDDNANAPDATWDSGLLTIAGINLEVKTGADCTVKIHSPKPVPFLSWAGLGGLLLGMLGLTWYARRRTQVV